MRGTFYMPPPVTKLFVIQVLMRDLFAVDNTFVHIVICTEIAIYYGSLIGFTGSRPIHVGSDDFK